MLLGLLPLPLVVMLAREVLSGAAGRKLIRVLAQTGILLLAWSVLTGIGLALGQVA
jgi:1,4-dihydroxy-2-naphthoate octaprenyltransferase